MKKRMGHGGPRTSPRTNLGPLPCAPQFAWLVLFGTVQMGMAYLLMARGLKYVSPQEAGTLTLLEPILNPLWAYLVSPEREKLTIYIVVGGICILGGWCIATDHSGR